MGLLSRRESSRASAIPIDVVQNRIKTIPPALDEVLAVAEAVNSGVSVVTSIHAGSFEELFRKPNYRRLARFQLFHPARKFTRQRHPDRCGAEQDQNHLSAMKYLPQMKCLRLRRR